MNSDNIIQFPPPMPRPPKSPTASMSVRVPFEVAPLLQQLASESGKTPNAYIQAAMLSALERRAIFPTTTSESRSAEVVEMPRTNKKTR